MDNARNFHNNLSYFINNIESYIHDCTQYVDQENELQILNNSEFFGYSFAPYEIERLEKFAQDFFEKLNNIPEYSFLNYGESEEIMENLAQVFVVTAFNFSYELDDILIPAQESVQKLINFRITIVQCNDEELAMQFDF